MKQTFFALLLSLTFSSLAFAQSGTWSAYHACSVGCGGGTTYRDCILNGQQVDASNCPGGAEAATSDCNTVPCGTIIGVWSAIHACDLQCMTYRDCIVNGRIADNSFCEGQSVQVCIIPPCHNVSFSGVWSDFGNCTLFESAVCNAGLQTRECLVNGVASSFSNCQGGQASSSRNCSTCAGAWSDWSGCDDDEASAFQASGCASDVETRTCLVNGTVANVSNCEGGGAASSRTCAQCAGTWSEWSDCEFEDDIVTCLTGSQFRDCLVNGTVSDSTNCEGGQAASSRSCPACTGTWTAWDECGFPEDELTCLTGTQNRDCLVNGQMSFTFIECEGGALAAFRDCPPCTGTWSAWSQCIAGQQNAIEVRTCRINGQVTPSFNCRGGSAAAVRPCLPPGELFDVPSDPSNSFPGVWSAGHACPVSCGTGVTYRDCILNGAQVDYSNCQGESNIPCNTGVPCPSFPGVWSAVHACPVPCGGGSTYRDCLVNGQQDAYSNCEGVSTRPCNTQLC